MKHHNPISTNIYKEVLAAEKRIRPHIRKTYLEYSPYLSSKVDGRVYLKLECMQHTGSFKYRGALNKFLSLSPEDRQGPVITASSGNHGTAFAAIRHMIGQHQILIEGAAALWVACLLKDKDRFKGKNTVLIISGKKLHWN